MVGGVCACNVGCYFNILDDGFCLGCCDVDSFCEGSCVGVEHDSFEVDCSCLVFEVGGSFHFEFWWAGIIDGWAGCPFSNVYCASNDNYVASSCDVESVRVCPCGFG